MLRYARPYITYLHIKFYAGLLYTCKILSHDDDDLVLKTRILHLFLRNQ